MRPIYMDITIIISFLSSCKIKLLAGLLYRWQLVRDHTTSAHRTILKHIGDTTVGRQVSQIKLRLYVCLHSAAGSVPQVS